MTFKIVSSDPDVLGGTPVFVGTRVPVAVLFENLADGMTLDEIIDAYPHSQPGSGLVGFAGSRGLPGA